jgi:Leucine-rich repeat (LRR) protein
MQKIANYQYLERVDLSFNCLKTLRHLNGLKFLTSIKATNNQLISVLDIKEAPLHLDLLDLGNNRITSIPDLSRHKSLRVLKLNANKIGSIHGLSKNKALRILDLSENVL